MQEIVEPDHLYPQVLVSPGLPTGQHDGTAEGCLPILITAEDFRTLGVVIRPDPCSNSLAAQWRAWHPSTGLGFRWPSGTV